MKWPAGFGIAFSITAMLLVPARLVFLWFEAATVSVECATGVRNLVPVMIGRTLSWGLLGLGMGLAMACANPRGKITLARIAGGLTAGLIAGMLFDPIQALAASSAGDAGWISRCSGFTAIGGLSGFFTGVAKEANGRGAVLVISGDSEGVRTLLDSRPACVGTSPQCDIVIEGSGSVMPRHAVVQKTGIGFEIQSLSRETPSLVNGKTINRIGLAHGDRIRIGDTDLLFTRPNESV
jgi:Inner membrane component of T3SS, cytoplasmic domain